MTTSPALTVVSRLTKSRLTAPSIEPLTTPSARLDWIMPATPERASVMSRTRALCLVTEIVWPRSPLRGEHRHLGLDAVCASPVDGDDPLPGVGRPPDHAGSDSCELACLHEPEQCAAAARSPGVPPRGSRHAIAELGVLLFAAPRADFATRPRSEAHANAPRDRPRDELASRLKGRNGGLHDRPQLVNRPAIAFAIPHRGYDERRHEECDDDSEGTR